MARSANDVRFQLMVIPDHVSQMFGFILRKLRRLSAFAYTAECYRSR